MTTPGDTQKSWFSSSLAKGIGAVATAAAIAVAGKLIADKMTGNPIHAEIKVVSFSIRSPVYEGSYATTTITVENQGQQTAADCIITWKPGIILSSGTPVQVTSDQFALDGGKQDSVNFSSPTAYEFTGPTTENASVQCNNTSDPGQQGSITVLP